MYEYLIDKYMLIKLHVNWQIFSLHMLYIYYDTFWYAYATHLNVIVYICNEIYEKDEIMNWSFLNTTSHNTFFWSSESKKAVN